MNTDTISSSSFIQINTFTDADSQVPAIPRQTAIVAGNISQEESPFSASSIDHTIGDEMVCLFASLIMKH